MKVLIIGGGGREHALAWKAAQSPQVSHVFVAPGNGGTALEPKTENVNIAADDIDGLLRFATAQNIDLTIVGPEAPLVAGICDVFAAANRACFGCSKNAAQLEGSKAFTKAFLARHKIPTARYEEFTDLSAALDYVDNHTLPIVVKADGLAAGKGVIIARTQEEARAAVRAMLGDNAFGIAGKKVVVEDFLVGEEASFIIMTDGVTILPFASSQDHKARDDADRGPNTGGMGAYSPAPIVTPAMHERIMREVIEPTVRGLAADGIPYLGFLYAGIMIAPDGTPNVLEFNCRFGDPETQPIMMRLKSDLVQLCMAAVERKLVGKSIQFDPRPALGVVMAARGYPDSYPKGDVVEGLPATSTSASSSEVKIFHAGTTLDKDRKVRTNGGRVLCVTALGDSVSDAQQKAYDGVAKITWADAFFRTDIGYRAVAREKGE